MTTRLKNGIDGLVHLALDATTICGADTLSASTIIESHEKPTCVQCMTGIVTCSCGSPGQLGYCGYAQEINNRDEVCRCCLTCSKRCNENA
jgi:hypothetical protein